MESYQVLHLIDHMGAGGAQRLVQGILQNAPNHHAVALRRKGGAQFWDGLPRFHQPRVPLRAAFIGQVLGMPARLRSENIDILHCHLNVSWLSGLWLARLMKRENLRLIFHEHDPHEVRTDVYRKLLAMVGNGGLLIAISKHVASSLSELGVPQERIRLLPNYVQVENFALPNRTFLQDRDRAFTVGFAGRLVERKGWRQYLETVKKLAPSGMRFVLAGDGPDRNAVVRKVKEDGLDGVVELMGHVSDMRDFFAKIDVFLMPVAAEPSGLVQLEAQAAGVPVAAYRVPGFDETISEENAMLVAAGDIEAMTAAVLHLRSDTAKYAELARRGMENAKRFSFETYMETLDRIYREALS